MAFETNAASTVASGGEVGADGQLNVPTEMENGFLGAHPKGGEFYSLKGRMLEPPELDHIEGSSAKGGSQRGYAPSPDGEPPAESINVNTPLTMGGGSFAR